MLLEHVVVRGVDLVAVAVPLGHHRLAVHPSGQAPRQQLRRVRPQPHGPSLVDHTLLLGQQVDDRVRRGRVELGGVRALEPADVPGELDHCALQPEAQPEVRDPLLPRELDGRDLPLNPPDAEPAGHQDAVRLGQHVLDVRVDQLVRGDPGQVHLGSVVEPAVLQRFDHREVGVLQRHVLADDRDVHRRHGAVDPVDQLAPFGQLGLGVGEAKQTHQQAVQPFAMQGQRDLVDGIGVDRRDHAAGFDVAQQRNLLFQLRADRPVGAAHDHVRLGLVLSSPVGPMNGMSET